jgi:hypothetical protein
MKNSIEPKIRLQILVEANWDCTGCRRKQPIFHEIDYSIDGRLNASHEPASTSVLSAGKVRFLLRVVDVGLRCVLLWNRPFAGMQWIHVLLQRLNTMI